MNASERHATKLLIDRAARAKLQGRRSPAVRLYGRTQRVVAVQKVFFPTGVTVIVAQQCGP
jgi:hypothetical protein